MKKKLGAVLILMLAAALSLSACRKKNVETESETTQAVTADTRELEAQGQLDEGNRALADEEYDEAIEAFERCIELNPANAAAYQGLFDAYYATEFYDAAIESLDKGIEATDDEGLKTTRIEGLKSISDICLEEEDYEGAETFLTMLIESEGEEKETLMKLSRAYLGLGLYDEAVSALSGAGDDDEVRAAIVSARTEAGEMLFEEGSYDEAISQLREAIALDPNAIEAYTTLGSAYIESERYDDAKALVQEGQNRFVREDSTVPDDQLDNFMNMASEYYISQDDVAACLQFWELAVKIRPNNQNYASELNSYRAMAADEAYANAEELLTDGNMSAASEQYKRAFSLAPGNYEGGLVFAENGTYCLNSDGSWKLGWYEDDAGGRYYFSPQSGNGYARALTGTQQVDGNLYYFEDDGLMLVDDTTPDGYYAGTDGRLTVQTSETEEAEETEPETEAAETEPEETEAETDANESSGPGSGSTSQTKPAETTKAAEKETEKQPTQKPEETKAPQMAVDFKFNINTLKSIKEQGGAFKVSAKDLFTGLNGSLSMDSIEACLMKYGKDYEWLSDKNPFELHKGEMMIWIEPGDEWVREPLIIPSNGSYRSVLHEKALPDDTEIIVEFNSAYGSEVDLDAMEKINNK